MIIYEEDHLLDALYVKFADLFRGTREDIKKRQSIYLPLIQAAKAGTKSSPVIDVGCGRGEWIELLKENQLIACGVDHNAVIIKECLERKLTYRSRYYSPSAKIKTQFCRGNYLFSCN